MNCHFILISEHLYKQHDGYDYFLVYTLCIRVIICLNNYIVVTHDIRLGVGSNFWVVVHIQDGITSGVFFDQLYTGVIHP